jgi:signal-transduction protein with cAMP-binding, CBS, and nucleotidyltransferase domain
MRIGEICTREVLYCERETNAVELAKLMRNHHVGDVIVAESREGKLRPLGIVTDRDLVVQIVAKGVSAETVKAGDMITHELVTAQESEFVYDAIWRMRSKGIRRLPVVDKHGVLIGMLTADDVTEFLAEELTEVARIVPWQAKKEKAALPPER